MKKKKDLEDDIANAKKGIFENYKTYFFNYINGKGFGEILKEYFNHYEKYKEKLKFEIALEKELKKFIDY